MLDIGVVRSSTGGRSGCILMEHLYLAGVPFDRYLCYFLHLLLHDMTDPGIDGVL